MMGTSGFRGSDMPNTGQSNAGPVPENLAGARRATISFWGPALIVIGALLLVSNTTHLDFGRLWPLWLIGIGAWLLLNRSRYDDIWRAQRHGHATREWWDRHGRYRDGIPPPAYPPSPGAPEPPTSGPIGGPGPGPAPGPSASFANPGFRSPAESVDDVFQRSVIFMSFNRRIMSQHFRFGKVSAVFGGFHLDFRSAEIDGNQAVLQIEAVFGGGEILVPPTWRVSVTAHEVAGAVSDETYSRPDAAAPSKVLIVHGTTVFGGVVIRN